MNNSSRFSSEMNTKIEIKEEVPLSYEAALENEREFFNKVVTVTTNNDAVLLGDCDVAFKTGVKSKTSFPDFSQKERECFSKRVGMQIKSETDVSSNNSNVDVKTKIEKQTVVLDFYSRNEKGLLPEEPVMDVKKYSSDHEMNIKIEIKEEPLGLETQFSSLCDDIKNEKFLPVKSSRSCMKAVSGDSSILSCTKSSEREACLYNGNNDPEVEIQATDNMEISTAEEDFLSGQRGNYSVEQMHSSTTYSKEKHFIHKSEKPHKCNICEKNFTRLSNLKMHSLIHEGKKPHQCKTCKKSFTRLSYLKVHALIHGGKKPHECETCKKSFTRLFDFKMHNLIHEGKKPHQCKVCGKSFTQMSNLNNHILIHEGKKPHQCKTCDKRFSRLTHLKMHNFFHEGKKPHKCNTCGKSFTQLSDLKRHNLIHEGKKPHQCQTCNRCFTDASNLKKHSLIHEDEKPHHCKACNKNFTLLSRLKRHNLIHERKNPH